MGFARFPSTPWPTGNESIGPQAMNHSNQFTSVTFNFNAAPGVPLGVGNRFSIEQTANKMVPPTMRATFQGPGPDIPRKPSAISRILMLDGSLRDVCRAGNPLRKVTSIP